MAADPSERALTDPALRARLGDELASRCEGLLRERVCWIMRQHTRAIAWPDIDRYQANGWQERSGHLYAAAAEVAGKVGPR